MINFFFWVSLKYWKLRRRLLRRRFNCNAKELRLAIMCRDRTEQALLRHEQQEIIDKIRHADHVIVGICDYFERKPYA